MAKLQSLQNLVNPVLVINTKAMVLLDVDNNNHIVRHGYLNDRNAYKTLKFFVDKVRDQYESSDSFYNYNTNSIYLCRKNIISVAQLNPTTHCFIAEFLPRDVTIKYQYPPVSPLEVICKIPLPYTYLIVLFKKSSTNNQFIFLESRMLMSADRITSLDTKYNMGMILANIDSRHKICWGNLANISNGKMDYNDMAEALFTAFFSSLFNEDHWADRNRLHPQIIENMANSVGSFGFYGFLTYINKLSSEKQLSYTDVVDMFLPKLESLNEVFNA